MALHYFDCQNIEKECYEIWDDMVVGEWYGLKLFEKHDIDFEVFQETVEDNCPPWL